MQVVDSSVEVLEGGRIRVTTILDESPSMATGGAGVAPIGEGPTGDAVPDKIVRTLIKHIPDSVAIADIQREVGGNPGTVNRQAWTLAANAPDLQIRLRGWVVSPERGHYALSAAARERVQGEKEYLGWA